MSQNEYFVTCPKGLEYLLADELTSLGLTLDRHAPAGVWVSGSLESGYRACLWSRLANRVILHLASVDGRSGDALYDGIVGLDWSQHLNREGRFRVNFSGQNDAIRNTQYGVQRVKDAVVDSLRNDQGVRPAVDIRDPDLAITVRLHRGQAQVGIDLSGESLHKRGYRTEKGIAPLRENLASALLIRASWPEIAAAGGELVDPLCGSATILIEAALMALDQAPGLLRAGYGFERWLGHQPLLWENLMDEARSRASAGRQRKRLFIRGYDQDRKVIATAWRNIERAGLTDFIHVEKRELSVFVNESPAQQGLVLTNPPYGERLSERQALAPLYETLGEVMRQQAQGWQMGVVTGAPELGHSLGLRSHRQYKLFNGPLPVQLLLFTVAPENQARVRTPGESAPIVPGITNAERAAMLVNRLRKNKKQLGTWARKNNIDCYRLYDADMPEFALAIDCYQTQSGSQVHIQEYAPPKTVAAKIARERLAEALAVIPEALGIDNDAMVCKQRERQTGTRQYEKQDSASEFFTVHENGCLLQVNLRDYLDTGLFLDHRPVRAWIQAQAMDKRFLNLFCYTGAATIHAGVGGAAESLSVDMSQTYLNWARANLDLNELPPRQHRLLQRDCLQWLAEKPEARETGFDLIFLDPPTFSNSARMDGVLDVQRDHARLIDQATRRLAPGGTLIFSTNFRRFRLSAEIESRFCTENITARTIDRDFQRNPRIHQCWLIQKRAT